MDHKRTKGRYTDHVKFSKFASKIANKRMRRAMKEEEHNPEDVVHLDIPLFIRLLEYAREDAKTDMDLHNLTDKIIEKSSVTGDSLTMSDYEELVSKEEEPEAKRMRELSGIPKS